MAKYSYKASSTSERKTVTGKESANNISELSDKLMNQGLMLISAKEVGEIDSPKRFTPVSRRELIDFLVPMEALLSAGVPVVDSFEVMSGEVENPSLSEAISGIKISIASGQRLHTSMANYGKIFDNIFVNIIKSGEESGTLEGSFAHLIRYYEWYDDLIAYIKKVTRYPIIALSAVMLVVVGMFTFVIPELLSSMADIGGEPPITTVIMLGISDFFKSYIGFMVAGVFAIGWTVKRLKKTNKRFLIAYDAIKLKIPLFGSINQMICGSRFSHNMSALLNAGVLLPEALEISSGVVGNASYEDKIMKAKLSVDTGEKMAESFRKENVFNPIVRKMIAVGEETGTIEKSLDYMAGFYDKEIPRRIDKIMSYTEHAITVFIAMFVMLLAAAVLMPVYGMVDAVQGR